MTQGVFENQVITQTFETHDILNGFSIGTLQEDFQLCEADFLRLMSKETPLSTFSMNLLFAVIGYVLSILPKWIGEPEKVSQGEWATLIVSLVVILVLFLIGKCLPNEKKDLINRITEHFKSAPKTRKFIREKK